ncbi:MAG: hypothetical protein LBU37_03565 [Tannerellaceae bacterium]|jgi:hypothetical protein|nr:hypothetical protein [Tannerellaceae bacterium]
MYKLLIFTLVALPLCSCGNGKPSSSDGDKSEPKDTAAAADFTVAKPAPIVNVYIENSGSMDGYVKGKTEFKGAIRDLLVLLKYHYDEDSINLFFINQQINKLRLNPQPELTKKKQQKIKSENTAKIDLTAFAQNIELEWRNGQEKEMWQSTNLNQIFKMILDKTGNNSISILFSDCIYSIHGSSDAIGLLLDEKSLTKDAFLSKWKNDKVPLATTIVKMKSKFDGKYYPFTGDDKGYYIKGNRPYYICVIANQEILDDFNKNIELKANKVEGFENKYTLLSKKSKDLYYSVLQSTCNKGRFKPDRDKTKLTHIHGIKDVDLMRGVDRIQFAVAVNYSNVQTENDYLTNPANYTVTTNNFIVKEIFPIDSVKINANDKNRIANAKPTHIIVLEAKTKAVSDVSFVLNKQIPQWIINSSTEDDTSQEKTEGKTFGLNYWVAGIAEAYKIIYPDNKYFFECTISIDK